MSLVPMESVILSQTYCNMLICGSISIFGSGLGFGLFAVFVFGLFGDFWV